MGNSNCPRKWGMSDGAWDSDGLVQCPIPGCPPKSIGEGARSLFGGSPESLENVSCSRATPNLHRRNLGIAAEQETFSRLSGLPPKRLLAPSPLDLRGHPGIGHCTRPSGSQDGVSRRHSGDTSGPKSLRDSSSGPGGFANFRC